MDKSKKLQIISGLIREEPLIPGGPPPQNRIAPVLYPNENVQVKRATVEKRKSKQNLAKQ